MLKPRSVCPVLAALYPVFFWLSSPFCSVLVVLSLQTCAGALFCHSYPGSFCPGSSPGSSFMAVLFCLFRSGCSFLAVSPSLSGCQILYRQSRPACPVLPVLFCLSRFACPVLPGLFFQSCSACPILPILFCRLTYSASPILPVLILPVLFCLSSSACPLLPVLFCLSCSAFPVLPFLFCCWERENQGAKVPARKVEEREKGRNEGAWKQKCTIQGLKKCAKPQARRVPPGSAQAQRLKKVGAQALPPPPPPPRDHRLHSRFLVMLHSLKEKKSQTIIYIWSVRQGLHHPFSKQIHSWLPAEEGQYQGFGFKSEYFHEFKVIFGTPLGSESRGLSGFFRQDKSNRNERYTCTRFS